MVQYGAFKVGEEALLTTLMGEGLDPPILVRIVSVEFRLSNKGLLEYEVVIPRVKSLDTSRTVDDLHVWAMAKWLVPAQIIIQETPESPYD